MIFSTISRLEKLIYRLLPTFIFIICIVFVAKPVRNSAIDINNEVGLSPVETVPQVGLLSSYLFQFF